MKHLLRLVWRFVSPALEQELKDWLVNRALHVSEEDLARRVKSKAAQEAVRTALELVHDTIEARFSEEWSKLSEKVLK